jgi:hypothetical protein
MNSSIIEKLPFSSNNFNTSNNENKEKNDKKFINETTISSNNSSSLLKNIVLNPSNLNEVNEYNKNQNSNKVLYDLFKENQNLPYLKIQNTRSFSHSFHINFNNLRIKLGIEDSRKTHIDSLLKKAKSKCLKAIHEVLKLSLNLLIGRLPQNFITNIKIDFNKKYLSKSIGNIYYEYKLLPSYEEIINRNLIRKGKFDLFNETYNSSFEYAYMIYIESDLYKKDFEMISLKDGYKNAFLYDYVAKNMCEYFFLSKGNKKKVFKNTLIGKKKKMFIVNY